MNDPGLDDAIAEEASTLDHAARGQKSEKQDHADVEAHQGARWWLASTAYPLIAVSKSKRLGSFCHMAMLTLL